MKDNISESSLNDSYVNLQLFLIYVNRVNISIQVFQKHLRHIQELELAHKKNKYR